MCCYHFFLLYLMKISMRLKLLKIRRQETIRERINKLACNLYKNKIWAFINKRINDYLKG